MEESGGRWPSGRRQRWPGLVLGVVAHAVAGVRVWAGKGVSHVAPLRSTLPFTPMGWPSLSYPTTHCRQVFRQVEGSGAFDERGGSQSTVPSVNLRLVVELLAGSLLFVVAGEDG